MPIGRRKAGLLALFLAAWGLSARPQAFAAQSKLDARLRVQRAAVRPRVTPAGVSQPAERSFRVLIKAAPGVAIDALRAAYPTAHFGTAAGPIITATVPNSVFADFESDPRVLRVEASRQYHPVLDVVRSNSQTGGGLFLGTTRNAASADLANADGTGVIVGVVDTGIDFRHKDFITPANTSRILYIWDQNDVGGPPPNFSQLGFQCSHVVTSLGTIDECQTTEWTQAQMTSDIQNLTTVVHSSDTNGHGTHVAGIAAGNGRGGTSPGTFVGMAPKADIIAVATDFTTPGILDAVNYIAARANQLNKRAVINLSLGGQIDPHDGTSAFDLAIAAVAASTPIVVAMGNDGTAITAFPHAQMASLAFNQSVTFNVSIGQYAHGNVGSSADIDFWKQTSDLYSVSLTVAGSPCGSTQASGSGNASSSPFSCSGHSVYLENANGQSTTVNPIGPDGSATNPNNEIYVQVFNSNGSQLTSSSLSIGVTFTCNNPSGCGRVDGFVDAEGADTIFESGPGYTRPSSLTMSSPATANNVFAVGSYASKTTWTAADAQIYSYGDGSTAGNISTFSGWGPTRDGRPKPDVAAPGDVIASTLSGDVVPGSAASSFGSAQILPDGKHAVLAGTSMAAPVVAGILATRLQGVPTRTVPQLRSILQGLARSDAGVANSAYGYPSYVNNGWNVAFGAGKVVASPQPIDAPTGLAAAFVGISSITWTWNPTTLSADAYDLYYASSPSVPIATAVQPPYTQTGLSSNTAYGIIVKGEGGGVDGPGASLTNVTTLSFSPPSNVAVAAVGLSSVSWTWSAALNAVSYNVYSSTGGLLANVSTTSFAYSNLFPNTPVYVVISAVDGSGTVSSGVTAPGAATLALPVDVSTPPVATAFISSIAVSFTSRPPSPSSSSCAGYLLKASTAADLSGTVFQSSTSNSAASLLAVSGLSALTTYYLRLATLNSTGGANFVAVAATMTKTFILAPAPSSAMTIASTTLRFHWLQGANPAGLTYNADASTNSTFAPPVLSVSGVDIFSASFAPLSVNTTYYLRVKAVSGPYLSTGPVSTLAAAPAAASPPFTGVGTNQLTANWDSGADPPGTSFLAQLSAASDFSGALVPAVTTRTFAVFSSLVSNTSYYLRVQAVNHGGIGTSFLVLPATSTLAQPVTLAAQPFSGQRSGGFTAGFVNSGGNAPGTLYLAAVSTAPDLSSVAASAVTASTYAAFSGLLPNTTYYFGAAAFNNSGALSAFSSFASTVTLPALPAAAAPLAGARTVSTLRLSWSGGGNPAPTRYTAQISSDSAFGGTPQSSTTANLYADFAGLLSNTTYYLRVKALSLAPSNPDSPFASLGGAASLANLPGAPASPFLAVTYASVTVQWVGLPASPSSAAAEGYRVEASTDPAFGGRLYVSAPYGADASQGGVAGLGFSTTYYLRVGSLNWNGAANFTALGSTVTLTPVQSTQTVSASGASVSVVPSGSPVKSIRADFPAGAFPPGTLVTINTSVQFDIPPPHSNQGRITALADGTGFSLSAQGLQPSGPVLVTLTYDPLALPPDADARSLQLARYDDAAGQWTFLPTYVDTTQNVLTARITHFSFYAPFLVAASASVDDAAIFPIPWEPGSGDALFDAPALTFSNLPADAEVSLFNLKGELLWKAQSSPGGILTWDGKNRFGRKAASGTYLAVIEGGGKRIARRVALIR